MMASVPAACVALALALCSFPAFGLTTANFLPLAHGNSWTYSVVDNGTPTTETETVTPSGGYFGDTLAFEIVSSDGSRSYELVDAAGYREFGGYSSVSASMYTFSPPAVIVPAAFDLGQTFSGSTTVTYTFGGVETLSGPVSQSTTAVGFESVTVPAGTFHALRMEAQIAATLSSASGVSVSLTATQTSWFAENVGLVKSTYADSDGQSKTRDLVSFSVPQPGGMTLDLFPDWNLVGNSMDGVLNVAEAFGDAAKVTTAWKWIASSSKWAFYAPSEPDGGAAYAAGKGYDFLTAINGGEGFWVNAKIAFAAQLPPGAAVASTSFQGMGAGWNLIAVGDGPTTSGFNRALSASPPSAGDIPLNLTTLWAWDSALNNWHFYAPGLEKDGTLAAYIASKNYLDFGTKKLDPGVGFWANRSASTGSSSAGAPAAGVALRVNLAAGAASAYTVAVTPGERHTVTVSGLSASVALSVYHGSDSSAACSAGPSLEPQYCTLTAASSALTVKLDASGVASASSAILGVASNPIVAAPISQSGARVTLGVPMQGQVAPRGTSSYAASGLTPGQSYTVSISGLSADADLHVFTDSTYSMELDCTLRGVGDVGVGAEECTTTSGGSLYFQARSGELNTDGASFIVIVR